MYVLGNKRQLNLQMCGRNIYTFACRICVEFDGNKKARKFPATKKKLS